MFCIFCSLKGSFFDWAAKGIADVFKANQKTWFRKGKKRSKGTLYDRYLELQKIAFGLGQIKQKTAPTLQISGKML